MSSFFTSFLSSIDDKSTSTPNNPIRAPQQPKDTSARNGSDPKVPSAVAGAKRKAEGSPGEDRPKVVKKPESTLTAGLSKPQTSAGAVRGDYQGTSRGLMKPVPTKPASSDASKKPTPPSSRVSARPKTVVPAVKASPAVPSSSTPSAQPKKNSFKEILARAQGQQSTTSTGIITHKRVEQPTKLSKKAQAEEARKKQAQIQPGPAKETKTVDHGSARPVKGGKPSLAEQKKKPVQVQYKGTMRAPVEYKGTMRAGNASRSNAGSYRGSAASKLQSRPDRYESYSEEDMEDEEEEEDYGSDVSSDMEAGAFDVDQEEELSLRQARREDLEALREEEEHKRKKLERKNKLAALAANARPRY